MNCARNTIISSDKQPNTYSLLEQTGLPWLNTASFGVTTTNGNKFRSSQQRYNLKIEKDADGYRINCHDQQKILDMTLFIQPLDEKTFLFELEISNTGKESLKLDDLELLAGTLAQKADTSKSALLSFEDKHFGGRPDLNGMRTPGPKESFYTIAIQSPPLCGGCVTGKKNINKFVVDVIDSTEIHFAARGECNGAVLAPGKTRTSDVLFISTHENPLQQLERFADLAAIENNAKLWPHNRAVWCSWYAGWSREKEYTYKNGLEKGVAENIPLVKKYFAARGGRTMRICDDFSAYGDWNETTKAIPDGFTQLADTISAAGLIPGVWYTPWWASTSSEIYQKHPDWFAKNPDGSIYRSQDQGQCRSRLKNDDVFLIFDTSNPEVLDYFEATAKKWQDRGYKYLTNDFLMKAVLPDKYDDPTLTKAEILRAGMEAIRRGLGENVFYRTIGAELGVCMGLSNDVRISGDSHGDNPAAYFRTANVWYYNHRLWFNDPSAIVCARYGELKNITWNKMWVSWIALSGSVMTYGEVLDELPQHYIDMYQKIFPPLKIPGRPLDIWENDPYLLWGMVPGEADGKYELFGLFDLDGAGKRHVKLNLDEISARCRGWEKPEIVPQQYLLWDFWEQKLRISSQEELTVPMPEKSCTLFALRPDLGRPQLLGTSGHFSQGAIECPNIQWRKNTLSGQVKGNGGDSTTLFIHIPELYQLEKVTIAGQPVESFFHEPHVLALTIPDTEKLLTFRLEFSGAGKSETKTRTFKAGKMAVRFDE